MGRYRANLKKQLKAQLHAQGVVLPLPEWRDASGRDMERGKYVAYSTGVGRSAVLKFGIVVELVSRFATKYELMDPPPPAGVYPRHIDKPYLMLKIKLINQHGTKSTLE